VNAEGSANALLTSKSVHDITKEIYDSLLKLALEAQPLLHFVFLHLLDNHISCFRNAGEKNFATTA
jgi:hypothetical protein